MIQKNAFWILTVLLIFVLQVTISDHISVGGVTPNLFLLATIFFAVRGGPLVGEMIGFVLGLFSDVTSICLFGSQIFMMTLIGYLVGRLERKVDEEKYSAQMVLVFLMSFLNLGGLLFLEALFGGGTQRFRDKMAVLGPLYSTMVSPILFWALLQWATLFGRTDLKIKL